MSNSQLYKSARCGASYEKITHPSGLTVYFMPTPGKAQKAAMISAKFGSVHYSFTTPDGRQVRVPNGTAHFLEHKLFEGEKGSAFDFYAETGAKANAYTSNDKTAYYFICGDRFDENLNVLLSFITHPYLTADNVEKEKGIIAQEIKMYEDDASWQGYFSMVQGLYCNHPIRRDIAGSVEDIYTLTPEILMDCYRTFYHPHNLVLAVAGDLARERVLAAVDRYFPAGSGARPAELAIHEPEEVRAHYIEKSMPISKPFFHLGFKDNRTDLEGIALARKEMEVEILLEYLFGRSAPFYQELYEQGLINSEYDCWYDLSDYFSFCVISGESDDPKAVESQVLSRLAAFQNETIDEDRFTEIRNGLYGALIMETDQVYSMVSRMVGNALNGAETFDAIEALAQVKPADLKRRAAEMFRPEASTLSVINPIEEELV